MADNSLAKIPNSVGLSEPGDKLEARVTDKGTKVVTVSKNGGTDKYSATVYPNGTIHETRTRKPR